MQNFFTFFNMHRVMIALWDVLWRFSWTAKFIRCSAALVSCLSLCWNNICQKEIPKEKTDWMFLSFFFFLSDDASGEDVGEVVYESHKAWWSEVIWVSSSWWIFVIESVLMGDKVFFYTDGRKKKSTSVIFHLEECVND